MGTGYIWKCPKCNKELSIFTGIGFLFYDKMLMDMNFSSNLLHMYEDGYNKEKLKELMPNGVLKKGYGLKLFQCPECKEYHNKIYFKVETENESFISKYICKKCNKKLRIARKPYQCSKCNVDLKLIDDGILWD